MNGIIEGKQATRWASLLAVVASLFVALVSASPALATKPTGEFVNFGDCPLSNPEVNLCVYALTSGGEVKIGSTAVPITKTITLQGGIRFEGEGQEAERFVPAADGNTLSKTPETVPGGLLKILAPEFFPEFLRNLFNEFINKGITGVTATTELVGNVGINRINLLNAKGVALTLPVRVHIENSFLGGKCYVGSASKPVTLQLTTGTTSPPPPNEPITGSVGELSINEGFSLVVLNKNSLVDNSFSAPEAQGCGEQILFGLFTGIVDSAVDSQLGIPSAAGHNTAILNGRLENAVAAAVKASEK